MKILQHIVTLIAVCLLVQCRSLKVTAPGSVPVKATIVQEGFINCFEQGLSANGQPVWCEASAVLFDGSRLFLANDKDMPDARTSVFSRAFNNTFADTLQAAAYLTNPIFKNGRKFEEFALAPDRKTVFLSTAFDRIKTASTEWNAYNTIFYWHGNPEDPQVLSVNHLDSTSVSLREMISTALTDSAFPGGMPYFKIEGLAATGSNLYFGIREEGKKFDEFSYKVKIITIPYQVRNGMVTIGNRFRVLADINIAAINPYLNKPLGLSSIEYDPYNKRFLILTSYENGKDLGAYLWTATLRDLSENRLTLVRDTAGNPLTFSHKAEDITIINKNKIIIINDDDKVATSVNGQVRQPNQAAYTIVELR